MTDLELRLHFQAALRSISEAIIPTWGGRESEQHGPQGPITTASTAEGLREIARAALKALPDETA
jgi:hypothetical protein